MAVTSIRGEVYSVNGKPAYRFTSTPLPNGMYAEGSWIMTDPNVEANYERAVQNTANFLRINRWDIAGQESHAPPGIDIDATQRRLNEAEAITQENEAKARARQERLKGNWRGFLSDAAVQDIITDPGEYLPSYITKLPQERAEEMIKAGKIGGWQVNDRFFRTKQEADAFINQNQERVITTTAPKPSWMPELFPESQVTKDLKKKFEERYEPYVTVEGTTVYKPRNQQPESVTVPRFGKMVPKKEDPATKFISENFEKGERFVSDKLLLHEILNPVIDTVQSVRINPNTKQPESLQKIYTAQQEFIAGGLTGLRDKPLTTAGNAALILLTTKGIGALPKIKGVTAGVGKGAVASKISAINILGVGLAAAYGYDVHSRITTSSSPARTGGEIAATELIPFAVGGYLGTKPLRIKSNINEAIKILKSQKEPLKAFYYDESGMLRKTKWQKEAGKPEKKEIVASQNEPKQGTDVFNYFKGRTPEQPASKMGSGGLGEFKSPYDRMAEQLKSTTGTGRESFLDYQKRVVSGILKPEASTPAGFVAAHKKIVKAEVILKSTTTKKSNVDALKKLWEDRELKASSKEAGTTTKEGQIVLTKQKTIQITKQEVKTAQAVRKKVKTIQVTKEAVKVVEKPKTGVYAIAYVSAANRLLNRLKENTLIANAVISREQVRTKPQTFTSETAKAIERIKERTKAIVSERVRLKEKERVREKVREKTLEKQKPRTLQKTKMRVPERLVKLGFPKFAQEISRIAKKRKKHSKYIWDVNNPVPTLEQVIG